MSTIKINDMTIRTSGNILIRNGRIIVDGVEMTPDSKEITITVMGDIETLDVDACSSISVTGNVGDFRTSSGDVSVSGNVTGSIDSSSGSITIDGDIGGSVDTASGSVRCKGDIKGKVSTISGDIN